MKGRSSWRRRRILFAVVMPLVTLPAAAVPPPTASQPPPAPPSSPGSVISFPTMGAASSLPGTMDVVRAAEPTAPPESAKKRVTRTSKPKTPVPLKYALLLQRAQKIEARLLAVSGIKKQVHVHLDPANMLNSWTDGSDITVTAGMLRFACSDDELAAILGHETGHIRAHHPAKVMTASIAAELGDLVAEALGGRDIGLGTAIGSTLALKKYSRDEESQADRIGLRLMEDAGFDGAAMPRLFDRMHQLESADPALLGTFLDDHPTDSERIRRLGTYPQLDPGMPANQVKLVRGLLLRGQPYQAALLALRLNAEHPGSPDLEKLQQDALAAAAAFSQSPGPGEPGTMAPDDRAAVPPTAVPPTAVPLAAAGDLRVVPVSAFDGDPVPPVRTLASQRDQVRRSSTGLYEVIYTLQGLSQQSWGRRTDEVGQYVWFRTFESGWREAMDLSQDLDPTSAAVWLTGGVSRMEAAAAGYPIPAAASSAAEAQQLTRLLQQRAVAARELEAATSDTDDATRSCYQDTRDLERGISELQLSLESRNDSASALQSPQLALTWNRSGAGGLARVDAHNALQKAGAAALRLEIAALDWQTRNLDGGHRLALYRLGRAALGMKGPAAAVIAPDAGLGSALFQDLARTTGPASGEAPAAVVTTAAGTTAAGTTPASTVGAAPVGEHAGVRLVAAAIAPGILPGPTEAPVLLEINGSGEPLQDPVSQAAALGQDLDLLHTIFHPVFVNLECEIAASVQVAAETSSRAALTPAAR